MKIEVEKLVLGAVSTNVYLVFYNGNCLIVDPSDEAERIISHINEKQVKPLAILITHGHFDHIMAAPVLAEKYGIKIYAGEADRQLLEDSKLNLGQRFLGEDFTMEADEYLKDGDELEFEGFRLKVLYTPGHTVGSISFYSDDLEDNEAFKKVIFSGDSLFAGSIGRVDLPTGNEATMRKTLEEVFKKMSPETVVFPGHGAATTIERELAHNPYLR
ncbi:metallo-beta-lactamase domain protein [Catonella morbi ATCC 51271]|uniref:Metallo-beta-lactamase domain protein n=1 Tax=Catonella morbi ATCC 51271 TaxID=592026 RepID=V2XKP1_9FIRM|nr:MBL fold metallo-hydrolase [Catonella morbi]ESL02724.1 metallo-beta-lactamase domain protein [Catonella morbi ATCC 51271]